jgi:hypothetical protein
VTGDDISDDEARAIHELNRLAARWPRTLTLVSMGGSLAVIRTGDPRYGARHPGDRQDAIIENIDGIPNDGGGW